MQFYFDMYISWYFPRLNFTIFKNNPTYRSVIIYNKTPNYSYRNIIINNDFLNGKEI